MKTPWWACLLLGYSAAILSNVTPEKWLAAIWAAGSLFFYAMTMVAFFAGKE